GGGAHEPARVVAGASGCRATGVAHPASWFAPLARSAGENGREAVLRDPCPGIGERVAVVEDREDVAIANEPGQGRGFVRRAGLREYVAAGGPAAHPVLERPVDAGDGQRGEERRADALVGPRSLQGPDERGDREAVEEREARAVHDPHAAERYGRGRELARHHLRARRGRAAPRGHGP